MRAVVIYESMYGNTHLVADAIGAGLRSAAEVTVIPVDRADRSVLEHTDLVVVGGPTHIHGLSRPGTRKAAITTAQKPDADLDVDPDAEGPGLRDWFEGVGDLHLRAAAFDTRLPGPAVFTGRASKGIARRLHHHGCTMIAEPESFLVGKDQHLEPHEVEHATRWGTELATSLAARLAATSPAADTDR